MYFDCTHNIFIGAEHCKKVEVYYCDLCRIYLPRLDDIERSLVLHCRSRNHLYLYVRYRDDQALRKRAERLHRLREEEKKLKKEEEESKKVIYQKCYLTKMHYYFILVLIALQIFFVCLLNL